MDALDRMGQAQRDEILALFPALRHQEMDTSFPGSRRSLTRKEAALLMDIAG